jgi:hypothetical protein
MINLNLSSLTILFPHISGHSDSTLFLRTLLTLEDKFEKTMLQRLQMGNFEVSSSRSNILFIFLNIGDT